MKTRLPALSAGALLSAVSAVSAPAAAHGLGVSRGDYHLEQSTVVGTLTFAAAELVLTVPDLEGDRIGLKQSELDAARGGIESAIVQHVVVTGDGAPCPGHLDTVQLTTEDGVKLTARFVCPTHPSVVDIDFAVVDFLTSGHRHLAHASLDGASADWVALRTSSSERLRVGQTPGAGGAGPRPTATGFGVFFRMGIEHILTGYDHLLFLAGLALAPGKVRDLALAITAFTVAHSMTLALATLGVWGPSARLVEPAIALSIAYVGVENCFAADFSKRWRVTFPFGLLHGFGFASALREVSMPRAEIPVALLSFNLGVETGQLAAVGAVLPLLFLARRYGLLDPRVAKVMSVGVGVAGAVWFVARVLAT